MTKTKKVIGGKKRYLFLLVGETEFVFMSRTPMKHKVLSKGRGYIQSDSSIMCYYKLTDGTFAKIEVSNGFRTFGIHAPALPPSSKSTVSYGGPLDKDELSPNDPNSTLNLINEIIIDHCYPDLPLEERRKKRLTVYQRMALAAYGRTAELSSGCKAVAGPDEIAIVGDVDLSVVIDGISHDMSGVSLLRKVSI